MSEELKGTAGQTGPIGALGAMAQCPRCGGTRIRWDAKSGVSSCDSCGWTNWEEAEDNWLKRIERGEIPLRLPNETDVMGDRMPMKVDILGTIYTLHRVCGSDDPRMADSDGFCDETTKEIFAETYENDQGGPNSKKILDKQSKKVVRHEIVHAFLIESGLAECSSWAQDEEAVDWFARQGPKIFQTWLRANAI